LPCSKGTKERSEKVLCGILKGKEVLDNREVKILEGDFGTAVSGEGLLCVSEDLRLARGENCWTRRGVRLRETPGGKGGDEAKVLSRGWKRILFHGLSKF